MRHGRVCSRFANSYARLRAAFALAVGLIAVETLTAVSADAQNGRRLSFIRDAEIEQLLRDYADPIFEAAGLPPEAIDIYIIQDDSFNAFVAGGRNMAFHTGLLERVETPSELMAVIAHETGHIAGGHLARRRQAMDAARGPMVLGMLLGVAAAAAGSSDAGASLITGGGTVAQRVLARHSRAEEAAADQAALSYLERVGINASGFIRVLERLERMHSYAARSVDPYVLSHPLSRERIAAARRRAQMSIGRGGAPDSNLQLRHDRMRGKLDGFLDRPERVLARRRRDDSEAGLYARAAAAHRLPDLTQALAHVDQLLSMRPNDPYYWELKGQILYESSRAGESVAPYRRAVALAPGQNLLEVGLAKALLAAPGTGHDAEALRLLQTSVRRDRLNAEAWRLLAVAETRAGSSGEAALATAEMQALRGNLRAAQRQARVAQRQFPYGSRGWLRAQDILTLEQ